MSKIRILAIREREWYREWKEWLPRPYLYNVTENSIPLEHPEKRYYHGVDGATYDTLQRKPHRIEKDYGVFDTEKDDLDAVYIQYCRDFPTEVVKYGEAVPHECGWLAPNGDYYPCHAWEHTNLAYFLMCQLWGKREKGDRELERLNWISVKTDYIYTGEGKWIVTQKQIDTLYLLYQKAQEAIDPLPELPKTEAFEGFFSYADVMIKH